MFNKIIMGSSLIQAWQEGIFKTQERQLIEKRDMKRQWRIRKREKAK